MRMSILAAVIVALLFPFSSARADGKKDDKNPTVGGKTKKEWLAELKGQKDAVLVIQAIQALSQYGADAQKDLGDSLIRLMRSSDSTVRLSAAAAAGMIGFDDQHVKQGISALINLLQDSQYAVKIQAANTLARFGPQAKGATTALVQMLGSNTWELRKAGAMALGAVARDPQTGPDARAFSSLIRTLTDPCQSVRTEALSSIIALGPPANAVEHKRAVLAIQSLLRAASKEPAIAIWCHVALMRMDKVNDTDLNAIAKYMKSSDPAVRGQAVQAIGFCGPLAKSRVNDLIAALNDKEPAVIVLSAASLAQMGEDAKPALPALGKLKDHKELVVQKAAAQAIEYIKNPKKPDPKKDVPKK